MSDSTVRRRRENRPTLATIARSAGVSIATVSKVVNGHHEVAPSTRALVEELLLKHDYAAPSTRRPTSLPPVTNVEFVVDGPFSTYSTPIMEGVLAGAAEVRASVGVSQLRRDRTSEYSQPPRTWARDLVVFGRTGVVVVTAELTADHFEALAEVGIPLVVIDPFNLPRQEVVSVGCTNFTGGLTATQHLLDLGHTRIAYVGGRTGSMSNKARFMGYRSALEEAGLNLQPDLVRHENFSYDWGQEAGAALLALSEPPTAVVGSSDNVALGVIEAAHARGLRVPDDLSVTGFNDTEVATVSSPSLTTVRQPLHEMGLVALRTIVRMSVGDPLESHHVELATELVVRRSTSPLRAH